MSQKQLGAENLATGAASPKETNGSTTTTTTTSSSTNIFSIDAFPRIPDRIETFPALEVPTNRTAELRKTLGHVLLRRPRTSNVHKPNDEAADGISNKRILVLSNENALDDPILKQLLLDSEDSCSKIRQTTWKLTWTYNDITTEEALRSLLPLDNNGDADTYATAAAIQESSSSSSSSLETTEIPTSFESVGTIAHINCPTQLLAYKYWIGKVILDKNSPSIKTVVNKIATINSEYRTFGMEVIAGYRGKNWSIVSVKEEGSIFDMDFTKVYWNSRLSGEHRRLVNYIIKDAQKRKRRKVVVADLMAGIGPFAIPLTTTKRKRGQQKQQQAIEVYANDLNPDSYKWLVHNSRKNKCSTDNLHCYNMDAREFVRTVLQTGKGNNIIDVDHVIMNLPATAPEFLDAFRGYNNKSSSIPMPHMHVHCFAPKESENSGYKDAIVRCEVALGCKIFDPQVRTVRNVAPNKNMVCVSFQLPDEVRNLPPITLNISSSSSSSRSTNKEEGGASASRSTISITHRPITGNETTKDRLIK